MEYHEFHCEAAPALYLVTGDRDRIPGAALACCRNWVYGRSFKLGESSHSRERDDAIRKAVAAEGYCLFIKRPSGTTSAS